MLFTYRAYDALGTQRRGLIEAPEEREAVQSLLAQGLYARSLRPAPAPKPLTPIARAALYRELAALLSAGLPLDRSLDLLREQLPEASNALQRLSEGVRAGRGFAATIADTGAGVTAYERAALASAEASASLPAMLERLARDLEARDAARARLRAALIYPCFVLTLGAVIAAVMLGVVVPKTTSMLEAAGLPLPASSRLLVSAARFVVFALVPLALVCTALLLGARWRARRHRATALVLDRTLLRVPLLSAVARLSATQRFASVLATLVQSGMTVPDALPLAAAATGHPHIEEALHAATERLRGGEAPAAALGPVPYLGPELAQWLRVGETGGCLPEMLQVAAQRLRLRTDRLLATRLALLEPTLLAAVGLFVLALALALLLPVLSITQNAGL